MPLHREGLGSGPGEGGTRSGRGAKPSGKGTWPRPRGGLRVPWYGRHAGAGCWQPSQQSWRAHDFICTPVVLPSNPPPGKPVVSAEPGPPIATFPVPFQPTSPGSPSDQTPASPLPVHPPSWQIYQTLLETPQILPGQGQRPAEGGIRQAARRGGCLPRGRGKRGCPAWRGVMGAASPHTATPPLAPQLLKYIEALLWLCVLPSPPVQGGEAGGWGPGRGGLPTGFAPAVPQRLEPGGQLHEGGSGAGGESPAAQHQCVDLGTRDGAVRGAGWPSPGPLPAQAGLSPPWGSRPALGDAGCPSGAPASGR